MSIHIKNKEKLNSYYILLLKNEANIRDEHFKTILTLELKVCLMIVAKPASPGCRPPSIHPTTCTTSTIVRHG